MAKYFIGNSDIILNDKYTNVTVEHCLKYFQDKEVIAIDTETKGKDWNIKRLLSLQIGDSENQYVIDVRTIPIKNFKNLLESKLCILHNAKFDYKFLKKAGIVLENIYDTMLVEAVLYCGYEKYGYSLANLCQRYLNITLSKDTRGEFFKVEEQPFTTEQILYAAKDVEYLHTIRELQLLKVKEWDLEYCVNLENEVVKALADIEYNGMYLNSEKWMQNTTDFSKELQICINNLDSIVKNSKELQSLIPKTLQGNLFGFEERELRINYSSPLQIQKICKLLGYKVDSTNDRELQKLSLQHEFFRELQNYRGLSKIISTYGEAFLRYINPNTNRVHTSFWQVLNTGRVSSGSKDDNAPNLQNLPADNKFRNCFEARHGFSWVSIDYSGQELRLMADASGEEGFIDVLNRGEDLHCYAGSMMFKKTITKADKDLRNKAKTINFGKPYGMGPPKLADTLSISIEEAEQLFKDYAKAFPKLNYWLTTQSILAKNKGYSVTFNPCKRRRWYPDISTAKELRLKAKDYQKGSEESRNIWRKIFKIEGQVERNGGNAPIQGTGADITKEALVEVRKLIQEYNKAWNSEVAYLICTVHDAIDVEVREDIAKAFAKRMAYIMIECGNKYVSKVKMEVDTTITKFWQK